MTQWKDSFVNRLNKAQSHWTKRFEEVLERHFVPVFDEFKGFLVDNGFKITMPMCEAGRRSYKFELAENAYLLLIFRSAGVGEFELRAECFVPASEPMLNKAVARIVDMDSDWARHQLQTSLDTLVDLLSGSPIEEPVGELVEI